MVILPLYADDGRTIRYLAKVRDRSLSTELQLQIIKKYFTHSIKQVIVSTTRSRWSLDVGRWKADTNLTRAGDGT